jgi:acyl-CoA synthetase (AMP-forming)/AMP-acid ligase II
MNLAWFLETGAREFPDKTAVVNPDHSSVTYAELNRLSNQIGSALRLHFGIGEDDVVVTLAGETHWHVALMFGLWKIGGVFSPLNRTQTYARLLHNIEDSRPKLLVVDGKFIELGKRFAAEGAVTHVAALDKNDHGLPSIREFSILRDAGSSLRMTARANADLAMINFTTGTTGPSKGAMMPHGSLITSYLGGVHWSGMQSRDVLLCTLYLFHAGGLSILLTGLVAHATVVLLGEPWSSDRAIDFLDKYRPDWLFIMVPIMSRDLARNPRFATLDCSQLKVHLAGEPVTPEVQKIWEDRAARTLIIYGMTESMAVCVTLNSFLYGDDERVGKGLVGIPNKEFGEVKLVDPISQEEIRSRGVEGEICFRGDVLTPGYYNDPVRTQESIDADGWFHTFDLGVCHENGYFTVAGRTDDIISTGAEKLSLIEVENAILQCPLVKDVSCVGVKHLRYGQAPAAIIVSKQESLSEEELRDAVDRFLLESFDHWKRPRLYVKVAEVPRTLAKMSSCRTRAERSR